MDIDLRVFWLVIVVGNTGEGGVTMNGAGQVNDKECGHWQSQGVMNAAEQEVLRVHANK
jgi:hypothetical protein